MSHFIPIQSTAIKINFIGHHFNALSHVFQLAPSSLSQTKATCLRFKLFLCLSPLYLPLSLIQHQEIISCFQLGSLSASIVHLLNSQVRTFVLSPLCPQSSPQTFKTFYCFNLYLQKMTAVRLMVHGVHFLSSCSVLSPVLALLSVCFQLLSCFMLRL